MAYVLLLLLPLQATAVATSCPHAKSGVAVSDSVAMAAMEHCVHDQSGDGVGHVGDSDSKPQSNDQTHLSCGAASACAMCAVAIGMCPSLRFESAHQKSESFVSSQYTSFIPDGLQRPPSVLA